MRRSGIEHRYKFDKQALLWAAPRLHTPAQMERWTDLVAAVHHQLALARPLAAIVHRPWETTARPVTPQQVRRAMARSIARVGTLARPPRLRGKAPGRAPGAVICPAQRHSVLRKSRRTASRKAAERCTRAVVTDKLLDRRCDHGRAAAAPTQN